MGAPTVQLPGHIRQLVLAGAVEQSVAERSVKQAQADKVPVLEWMFRNRVASAKDLAKATGAEYGLITLDLEAVDIRPDVADLISDEQKNRLNLTPLFRYGNNLLVALADPVYLPNLDDVKFATGLRPTAVIVEFDKLHTFLSVGSGFAGNASTIGMAVSSEAISQNIALDTKELKKNEDDGEEVEIISFVDKLLTHAINTKVSDIHIEPYEKNLRIRYRVDGMLKVIATPPTGIANRLVARIKVLARMDISERRVPQDGRIRFSSTKRKTSTSVSIPCRPSMAKRSSCGFWTRTMPLSGRTSWALTPDRSRTFLMPCPNRTAWYWSRGRPAAVKPSPCIPDSASSTPRKRTFPPQKIRRKSTCPASIR